MSPTSRGRVLFLTLYPETMPSSRLRVYQYLPYLEKSGITSTVSPLIPEPWFSRFYYSPSKWMHFLYYGTELIANLKRILQSTRYDAVLIQKAILSTNIKGFDRLFHWANRRLIFDLDDAVYDKGIIEFSAPFLKRQQDPDQAKKISTRAQAVIAGNSYLKKQALQYNSNVHLIPTPVDTNRFLPRKEKIHETNEIVIGWIGGLGPFFEHFLSIKDILQEISHRYPNVRVKAVTKLGQKPFQIPGVHLKMVSWSYATEVREMEAFDIGIMPLPDDEWSKGKCGLKLLQYMSMEIPSIASRVGTNLEIIEDGVDGFLAGDKMEWIEKLSCLIEGEKLRKEMGVAARVKVIEAYSLAKTSFAFAKILKDVSAS